MKRLILFCLTFLLLVLTACAEEPAKEQVGDEGDQGDDTVVTVYRSPA